MGRWRDFFRYETWVTLSGRMFWSKEQRHIRGGHPSEDEQLVRPLATVSLDQDARARRARDPGLYPVLDQPQDLLQVVRPLPGGGKGIQRAHGPLLSSRPSLASASATSSSPWGPPSRPARSNAAIAPSTRNASTPGLSQTPAPSVRHQTVGHLLQLPTPPFRPPLAHPTPDPPLLPGIPACYPWLKSIHLPELGRTRASQLQRPPHRRLHPGPCAPTAPSGPVVWKQFEGGAT